MRYRFFGIDGSVWSVFLCLLFWGCSTTIGGRGSGEIGGVVGSGSPFVAGEEGGELVVEGIVPEILAAEQKVYVHERFRHLSLVPEVTDYLDVPVDRVPTDGWVHPTFKSLGGWEIVNVADLGILPNGSDVGAKLSDEVENRTMPTVYYFPPGTYVFNSGYTKLDASNFILRGAGKDQTTFQMNASGLIVSGTYADSDASGGISVVQDVDVDALEIPLQDASSFG